MNNTSFADSILSNAFSGLSVSNTDNIDKVAEMLDKYGLRWEVKKEQLLRPNGTPSGFYGVVRQDTGTTFATCKSGYELYQNSELAELLLRICNDRGYEIHKGGLFEGGAKVYLQLKTNMELKNLGANGTTVHGYITGINGHDLSSNLKWGTTDTTICCKNDFNMVRKELKNSARHTANMRSKIEQCLREIEAVEVQHKTLFETYIKMAEIPVTKTNIAEIVNTVTEVDINKTRGQAEKDYSTYKRNRAEELLTSIAGEMAYKGNTLWGLFSGVTHYTTHTMPAPNRENGKLESKYTGGAYKADQDAYKKILSFM